MPWKQNWSACSGEFRRLSRHRRKPWRRCRTVLLSASTRQRWAAKLLQLDKLLAGGDSDATEAAEQLADQLVALGQGRASKSLLKMVSEFEFDAARERVQEIARSLDLAPPEA